MKKIICSGKGSMAIILCLLFPIIISILGLSIDGGFLLYNKAKLSSSTKFASISATAFYTVENGVAKINSLQGGSAAYRVLQYNFQDARIKSFIAINNECTVESEADVTFFFIRIIGIKEKTISESYTAHRDL
jgi:Flp pilus assembly protein TadG